MAEVHFAASTHFVDLFQRRVSKLFADDLAGISVVAECNELRMPKPILGRPFQKLNRGY